MRKSISLIAVPLIAAGIGLPLVGASAATAAPALTGGVEHVYVGSAGLGKASNAPTSTIIFTGAFNDFGHTGGQSSGTTLQKGKIYADLSKVKPVSTTSNRAACTYSEVAAGPITIFKGTGRYKGISGVLSFTETFVGVGARLANGRCNLAGNAPTVAGVFYGHGTGKVHF